MKKLITDFKATAVVYGESLEIGDHKTANKASRRADDLKKKLVSEGRTGIELLLNLLNDDDPWIRYAAASSTLAVEPKRAYTALKELQTHPGALGAAAYAVLRMSETGASRA